MKPITYASAAAIIDTDNRILINKRPEGKFMAGYWEFPGGKVETNETPIEALSRELKEELSITICKSCFSPVSFLSFERENDYLILYFYAGRKWDGIVAPNDAQTLKWVNYPQLKEFDFLPLNNSLISALERYF